MHQQGAEENTKAAPNRNAESRNPSPKVRNTVTQSIGSSRPLRTLRGRGRPCPAVPEPRHTVAIVTIEFCSPDGELLVRADIRRRHAFVMRTLASVPGAGVCAHVDVELARILAD